MISAMMMEESLHMELERVPYEEYAKVCAENKGLKEALEEYRKIEAEAVQEQAAEAPAKTAGKKKASE